MRWPPPDPIPPTTVPLTVPPTPPPSPLPNPTHHPPLHCPHCPHRYGPDAAEVTHHGLNAVTYGADAAMSMRIGASKVAKAAAKQAARDALAGRAAPAPVAAHGKVAG